MNARNLIGAVLIMALASCGGGSSSDDSSPGSRIPECTGFGDWQTSAFVLPYPVGTTYRVNQGNCSGFGHSDFWAYGYDFEMPIGTVITAVRDGVVVHAQDGAADGDRTRTNLITVRHADGTVALYSHLTLNGVHVTIGQAVVAGEVIGQSGDTGNTGGLPHLHFSLHPCSALPGLPGTGDCPSIPANFRNTAPNPVGPLAGRQYTALPFDEE
jgi:murein DD-endopeptidase MepM/ murein hydrolase activator NlpD